MKTRCTWIQLLILTATIALVIAFVFPAVQRLRAEQDLALCKDHLRRIGSGLAQYARANGGRLPVADAVDGPQRELLDGLAAGQCLGDPRDYYCPARHDAGSAYGDDRFKAGIVGYYYYSARGAGANSHLSKFLRGGVAWPRMLDASMGPKTWVMSDVWVSAVPTAHAGYRKGVNYLMLDGGVDFVSGSPRQAFH